MEQIKEMTAQESLKLIAETFNKSRKGLLRGSAKYFMLWGALLTVTSLFIYLLWHLTGKPNWNFLWFAMPVIGYPVAALMGKYDFAVPQNEVSKMLSGVWRVFGAFAVTLSVQIDKLTTAGYITVEKGFKGKMPRTACRITPAGQEAFKNYVSALQEYLSASKEAKQS